MRPLGAVLRSVRGRLVECARYLFEVRGGLDGLLVERDGDALIVGVDGNVFGGMGRPSTITYFSTSLGAS